MTMSLPDAVLYAYRSSAARITLSPGEARSYGRRLEYSSPDEIRAYHYGLMKLRDAIVLPHVQRALDEVERDALAEESGILLHVGLVWGDLAYYCAAAEYWPKDEDVPIDVERQLWSATLYWTHVLEQEDEVTMAEWTLCVTVGIACESEIQRRLDQHPVSKDVLDIVSENDPAALQRNLRLPYIRNDEESSLVPDDEVPSILSARLGELIDRKVVRHWMWAAIQASEGAFDQFPPSMRNAYLDELDKPKTEKRGGRNIPSEDRRCAGIQIEFDDPAVTNALERRLKEAMRPQLRAVKEAELRKLEQAIGPPAVLVRFLHDHPEGADLNQKELANKLGVTPRTIRNWRKRLCDLRDHPEMKLFLALHVPPPPPD